MATNCCKAYPFPMTTSCAPATFTLVPGGTALTQPSPVAVISDADIERIARRVAEILREGKP